MANHSLIAFLVKPVDGETQRMELVQIDEALKNGIIAENWLVRDERQDFWYSVGKVVGKVTSQTVEFFCRKCLGPIRMRRSGGQSSIFDQRAGQFSGIKRGPGRHDKAERWRRTPCAPALARGNGRS
jgi:hypothetical protein